MENEKTWLAWVSRYPFVSSGTPEHHEEDRLLEEAGCSHWKRRTQHETREEARAAVKDVLDKVAHHDPTVGWVGFWFHPSLKDIEGESECAWMYQEPKNKSEV